MSYELPSAAAQNGRTTGSESFRAANSPQDGMHHPRQSSARGRRKNLSEPRTRTTPRDVNAVQPGGQQQRHFGLASSSKEDSRPTASLRTNSRPASVPKKQIPTSRTDALPDTVSATSFYILWAAPQPSTRRPGVEAMRNAGNWILVT